MIEEIHYDEKGRLITPPDSYARLVQQFDERNNKIEATTTRTATS